MFYAQVGLGTTVGGGRFGPPAASVGEGFGNMARPSAVAWSLVAFLLVLSGSAEALTSQLVRADIVNVAAIVLTTWPRFRAPLTPKP